MVGWGVAAGAPALDPEPPSWTVTVTVTVDGACGLGALLGCWGGTDEYGGV